MRIRQPAPGIGSRVEAVNQAPGGREHASVLARFKGRAGACPLCAARSAASPLRRAVRGSGGVSPDGRRNGGHHVRSSPARSCRARARASDRCALTRSGQSGRPQLAQHRRQHRRGRAPLRRKRRAASETAYGSARETRAHLEMGVDIGVLRESDARVSSPRSSARAAWGRERARGTERVERHRRKRPRPRRPRPKRRRHGRKRAPRKNRRRALEKRPLRQSPSPRARSPPPARSPILG